MRALEAPREVFDGPVPRRMNLDHEIEPAEIGRHRIEQIEFRTLAIHDEQPSRLASELFRQLVADGARMPRLEALTKIDPGLDAVQPRQLQAFPARHGIDIPGEHVDIRQEACAADRVIALRAADVQNGVIVPPWGIREHVVQDALVDSQQLRRDAALGGGGHVGHALERTVLDRRARACDQGRADELGPPFGQSPQGPLELLPLRQVRVQNSRHMLQRNPIEPHASASAIPDRRLRDTRFQAISFDIGAPRPSRPLFATARSAGPTCCIPGGTSL